MVKRCKFFSVEHRKKIGESNSIALKKYYANGGKVWNKGLTKETDKRVAAGTKNMKRTKNAHKIDVFIETRVCKCGCKETFDCESINKKKFVLGHHTRVDNPMWKEENKAKFRGSKSPTKRPEVRKKMSESTKKGKLNPFHRLWKDPEFVAKRMKAIRVKPNKLEKSLDKLLQRLFPNQYKFVGDGEFILASKCPDFVNIAGQKKIIEVFGDYWHGEERTGVSDRQHAQERIDLFAKYGYQTLIIWERDLVDVFLLKEKLFKFNREKVV